MEEEENKQVTILRHLTTMPSVHCTTKTTKLLFCNLLESSLLGNTLFLQLKTNVSGVVNSHFGTLTFIPILCVYSLL